MAVDISDSSAAGDYPVTHYAPAADVPGGVNSDTYKTTKILMRLIPKGTFTMGERATDYPGAWNIELHQVTPTESQWDEVYTWAVTNGYGFDNAGSEKATGHPVHSVSWYDDADSCRVGSLAAYWPGQAPDVFGFRAVLPPGQ